MTVEQLAQQMYETQQNRCIPSWDQLFPRGATQSVWIERAQARLDADAFGDLA